MTSRILKTVIAALALGLFAACTSSHPQNSPQPMVSQVEVRSNIAKVSTPANDRLQALKAKHGALKNASNRYDDLMSAEDVASGPITGQVTLVKSQILNRVFLFGADLQYSSIGDTDDSMLVQSLATNHIPVHFAIFGNTLQLIADQEYLYESDIDHPERLAHEFPIVSQDANSVTITVSEASPLLATIVGQQTADDPSKAKPVNVRTSWIRSLQFVTEGDYLLIESTVEMADGTVAEFMESVFPRSNIVPDKPVIMYNDPALEPLAKRYRFLDGDKEWADVAGKGRIQTKIVTRFDPAKLPQGNLDWYVTANAPAQYLSALQLGVEGWNRYSQKMWGRDFIHFKGVLPAGVKIGDPRYNVINWDSVPDASAAYESQAFDPSTGYQSHSLIYLPYAWIQIGQEYWKDYSATQTNPQGFTSADASSRLKSFVANASLAGQPLRLKCQHELAETVSLDAIRSPDVFAFELLKQVLFHEVGHSLGFAHNFKGSLSFNPDDPKTMFSSSIMDYNQYELEDAAYDSENVATGPLLEYDRQVLSVLYNGGKDVVGSDPVLPACDDDESDSYKGGSDPFCIRYDAGNDPTMQLVRTRALVEDPSSHIARAKSLVDALKETSESLGNPSTVSDQATAKARLDALAGQIRTVSKYYFTSGAQSLNYMARANVRSLYTFRDGTLPSPLDPSAVRQRVVDQLTYILDLSSVHPTAATEFDALSTAASTWLKATPWYQQSPITQQSALANDTLSGIVNARSSFETDLLPTLRTAVAGALIAQADAPFYFLSGGTGSVDEEATSVALLKHVALSPIAGQPRGAAERKAAIMSLKTFKNIPEATDALSDIAKELTTEIAQSKTADDRAALRALQTAAGGDADDSN